MRPRLSRSPVKRLGLMAEYVASSTPWPAELHRERIGFVVRSRRHRQTDHDARPGIEFSRRQHDQRVHIPHLAASLRIAINPYHVTPVRAPRPPAGHYISSLPTGRVAMVSPP